MLLHAVKAVFFAHPATGFKCCCELLTIFVLSFLRKIPTDDSGKRATLHTTDKRPLHALQATRTKKLTRVKGQVHQLTSTATARQDTIPKSHSWVFLEHNRHVYTRSRPVRVRAEIVNAIFLASRGGKKNQAKLSGC